MKKLTIEFIRESFFLEGYTLLTKEYINAHQKLIFICPKDHKGNIIWHNWQQGKRCAECSGNKKLTIEYIRESFQKEGYTLLAEEYINNNKKLEYICPEGHKGSIIWNSWKTGNRCEECGGTKKLTVEYIREQFQTDGYTLLSKEYINAHQKLIFICPKDHKHSISWDSWNHGHRCAKCFFENNTGENNSSYNPNLTDEEREKNRDTYENKVWRKAIIKRDKYTCQKCGKTDCYLEAHHDDCWADNPELRYDIDNGITLCKECHRTGTNAFHKVYGYRNTTTIQTEEFLKNDEKNN